MKSGMDKHSGQLITGLAYLRQRLEDVVNTPLGSLVGARAFGSRLYQLVDRNVDTGFYMAGYVRLAECINNPVNGLDDFTLKEMRLQRVSAGHIEIAVSGEYLAEGEPIELDGIVLDGRD